MTPSQPLNTECQPGGAVEPRVGDIMIRNGRRWRCYEIELEGAKYEDVGAVIPEPLQVENWRERFDWLTGDFRVYDPDPADDHGAIYLVGPDGAMFNLSSHAAPGMDAARLAWIANTLNSALSAPPVEGWREAVEKIARASERSETMFGGKMSDVTRVFQNISRVAREALAIPAPAVQPEGEDDECERCVGTGTVQTLNEGPPTYGFATCPACGGSGRPASPDVQRQDEGEG